MTTYACRDKPDIFIRKECLYQLNGMFEHNSSRADHHEQTKYQKHQDTFIQPVPCNSILFRLPILGKPTQILKVPNLVLACGAASEHKVVYGVESNVI